MQNVAEIINDYVSEFSRLHNWMTAIKDTNPETYESMHDRYIEIGVTLSGLGVNLTELDKMK